jgi:hypothetical protein
MKLFSFGASRKKTGLQQSLTAHDVQDIDPAFVMAIEDATGRLNDLTVAPTSQLLRL